MSTPDRAPARTERVGDLPLTTRNASLGDLAEILKDQQARKVDVVAPASAVRSEGGVWHVKGADPVLTADGVTASAGAYRPTSVADEGMAEKLGIPRQYLRRLRDERPDLYDANVNGWLHGSAPERRYHGDGVYAGEEQTAGPDSRSFLVRAFKVNGTGVARALLSDRYRIVDNLDVLTAALDGVRQSGAEVEIDGCDLTERRMYVRIVAPAIREYAEDLLAGYRSPFGGQDVGRGWTPERVAEVSRREGQALAPDADPVVFAGFVLSNSETGGGAFTITPRLVIKVCNNGLTITADALRNVHLGGKLEEGLIRWSDETQQRNLELVTSQARDAVTTFLDRDYLRAKLDGIREAAGRPIDDPAKTVKHVASTVRLGSHHDAILDHFIRGGQMTAGGVMQAVTSVAQTLDDADQAAEVEGLALDALAVAAR